MKENNVIIDTGKFNAICDNIGSEHDPDAAVKKSAEVKRKLSLYEIYHRGLGWIESQIFKMEASEKIQQKV